MLVHVAYSVACWRRLTRISWIIASLLVATTATACFSAYRYQMNLQNDSQQTWLVRLPVRQGDPPDLGVWMLTPGASGAVAWQGTDTPAIEVLDEGCTVVGSFQSADGKSFSIPAVAGLSGHIASFEAFGDRGENRPVPLDRCGGVTYH